MQRFLLNSTHPRHVSVYKVQAASFVGGFCSFLFGASLLPWLLALAQEFFHWFPWWNQPHIGVVFEALPKPLDFVASPNVLLGLIWLLYYGITYLLAATSLSARQQANLHQRLVQEYPIPASWYTDPSNPSSVLFSQQRQRKEQPALAQAWPGEQKWELVEHCYQLFRNALERFDPPPVKLRTPTGFYYRKNISLEWIKDKMWPVLPEEWLTPERIHLLLPLLAHHLAWFNTEGHVDEALINYPDYVPFSWLLVLTGNFLWLPVKVKHSLEGQFHLRDMEQRKQRVLDADRFAFYLGQGPALEHLLRRMHTDLEQRGEVDRNVPTLIERIGHLEALNKQEREQMRKLNLKPKEPPVVQGQSVYRIGSGVKQKRSS